MTEVRLFGSVSRLVQRPSRSGFTWYTTNITCEIRRPASNIAASFAGSLSWFRFGTLAGTASCSSCVPRYSVPFVLAAPWWPSVVAVLSLLLLWLLVVIVVAVTLAAGVAGGLPI
jgi:hypothetical protein